MLSIVLDNSYVGGSGLATPTPTLPPDIKAWCDQHLSAYRLSVYRQPCRVLQFRKGIEQSHTIMIPRLAITFDRATDYVLFRMRWENA